MCSPRSKWLLWLRLHIIIRGIITALISYCCCDNKYVIIQVNHFQQYLKHRATIIFWVIIIVLINLCIPRIHNLFISIVGFYCMHLAKQELFPRISSPMWIQARVEQQLVWDLEDRSEAATIKLWSKWWLDPVRDRHQAACDPSGCGPVLHWVLVPNCRCCWQTVTLGPLTDAVVTVFHRCLLTCSPLGFYSPPG